MSDAVFVTFKSFDIKLFFSEKGFFSLKLREGHKTGGFVGQVSNRSLASFSYLPLGIYFQKNPIVYISIIVWYCVLSVCWF